MQVERCVLPMVALRGLVVFPAMVTNFEVAREISIAALESAMQGDRKVFLVAQKDMRKEHPEREDLYDIGTVARIRNVLKLPGDVTRVMIEGLCRARLIELFTDNSFVAQIEEVEEEPLEEDRAAAYMRLSLEQFEEFAQVSGKISQESVLALSEMKSPSKLADTIAINILQKAEERQEVLELSQLVPRFEHLIELLGRELKVLLIEREIGMRTRAQIEKLQKETYLREQIRAIRSSLGETDGETEEIEEFRKKTTEANISDTLREKLMRELSRMEKMSPQMPDYHVIRNYVEWVLSLPFGIYTEDEKDLSRVSAVLEREHYGLEKVKERVLEYLAVRSLKKDLHGPILCFVGPPGVGKTSIAHSIARALGKNFVRMSLGGVHDEAEIRGHRRTYIGAIPGRIVSSIRQAGSMNPLFLLDEIDKMASDFRGDPASAMLEVLDPMINSTFADHYLDMEFDLSQVMFVTTANDPDAIPQPLLDRMEMIEISSYTADEKEQIAIRHLIPKQITENGLTDKILHFEPTAICEIISGYTAEGGVRSLEREIAEVCRKAAKQFLSGRKRITIRKNNLESYLGIPKRIHTKLPMEDKCGVAVGLAWTSAGGTVMPVEVVVMEGTGKLTLTGQLGEVMQESAKTGISLVRSHAEEFGIDADFSANKDIHIHVPEGAVPKDGPSAGITMAAALVSALSGRPVRHDVAMTGEITLTGRVLAIGGLREKTLAALREGIQTVVLPAENRKNLEEIPKEICSKLKFVQVEEFAQVVKAVLV